MEFGTIEREVLVDASPEVVFAVISQPEHIKEWWGAAAVLEPVEGMAGELAWDGNDVPRVHVAPIVVVSADPPRSLSFRWTHPDGEVATAENSLLVTFDLVPAGDSTVVRLTETGFREKEWEAATLEAAYRDHQDGWSTCIPRIGEYVARLVAAS